MDSKNLTNKCFVENMIRYSRLDFICIVNNKLMIRTKDLPSEEDLMFEVSYYSFNISQFNGGPRYLQ